MVNTSVPLVLNNKNYMYSNVNFSMFCDSFSDTYKNNFSWEGKRALYDYITAIEEDTGEDIELDTVALCCEYSEYDSLEDAQEACANPWTLEELEERTTVIQCDNGHIILADF